MSLRQQVDLVKNAWEGKNESKIVASTIEVFHVEKNASGQNTARKFSKTVFNIKMVFAQNRFCKRVQLGLLPLFRMNFSCEKKYRE